MEIDGGWNEFDSRADPRYQTELDESFCLPVNLSDVSRGGLGIAVDLAPADAGVAPVQVRIEGAAGRSSLPSSFGMAMR